MLVTGIIDWPWPKPLTVAAELGGCYTRRSVLRFLSLSSLSTRKEQAQELRALVQRLRGFRQPLYQTDPRLKSFVN